MPHTKAKNAVKLEQQIQSPCVDDENYALCNENECAYLKNHGAHGCILFDEYLEPTLGHFHKRCQQCVDNFEIIQK